MKPFHKNFCFFDIETSPLVALVWGRYQQNAAKVLQESELLTAAWQFGNEKKPKSIRRDAVPGVMGQLWEVLDRAEVVIGHNIQKFDRKKMNTFFAKCGLPPVSDYQIIDTLTEVKKNFALSSNRLGDVCEYFGLGKKAETGGIDLWDAARLGDKKALVALEKYNKHDVTLVKLLYEFLLPWIQNHPNVTLMTPRLTGGCPTCGSSKLKSYGRRYTKTQAYRRFRCLECGKFSRSRVALKVDLKKKGKVA